MWFANWVTGMYVKMPAKLLKDRARLLARMRVTRTALALLQLRQDTGTWPNSVEAVIPLVGEEAVTDLYTNKRLQYEPGVRLEAAVPISSELQGEFREDMKIVWRFK